MAHDSKTRSSTGDRSPPRIDVAADQSFPASDPPPWSGSKAGAPGPARDAAPGDGHITLAPDEARQAEVVLNSPRKRRIYAAAVALVLLGAAGALWAFL